jgi:hypothetical protein
MLIRFPEQVRQFDEEPEHVLHLTLQEGQEAAPVS